jgi:hypothetical protein
MPPISQTETVEPQNVASHREPVVDPPSRGHHQYSLASPRRLARQSISMTELAQIAPALIDMADRIVWATVSTVDRQGRPRSRILHPYWIWDSEELVGWIATGPAFIGACFS